MHKSANYIPSPVAEGEVTLEVEVDALSRDGGARSATEQAVPLAAQADNASAAHRTHSGPSSVLGTDTRSEAGSDDDDETNQDVLRNAGLAIDPEVLSGFYKLRMQLCMCSSLLQVYHPS